VITVVSAAYGAYDAPAVPLEQDVPVRWVMVTDGSVQAPEPWETIVEPRNHLHPRMAAKIPKCLPHRYAEALDVAIWLDASATIHRPDFVSTCVAALGDGDVAMWRHPQRDDIVEEADVSMGMAKYAGQPVHAQAASYISPIHLTRHSGLWATGCMAWAPLKYDIAEAGRSWLLEQTIWTYQDQISWPHVAYWHELDIRPLPGGLWDRYYLSFRPHASDR
jgi:hypothetical protein